MGLDLDGTLEVSNSFPLPHHAGDEDDKSSKSVGELAHGFTDATHGFMRNYVCSALSGIDVAVIEGSAGR